MGAWKDERDIKWKARPIALLIAGTHGVIS